MSLFRSPKPDRRRLLGGGLAAAALLAAPAVVGAEAKALKIAVVLPRSGYLAAPGQACHRGALISAKVLSDYGYRVELMHVDFETNVDVARTQVERAIGEGAQVVTGAFESAATMAIAQVCEQRQVPLVVNLGSAPQITEQGYKFLVRNFQTNPQLLINGLKAITDLTAVTTVGFESAVFLHANDTFGTGQRQAMDRIFPQAGMPFELRESIAYDPKAQDLTVEVAKIRGINPDLVLIITRAADAIKLVRDMVRQRFEPKAIISPGSPGLYDEEFFQALGPLADYHIVNIPWVNPKAAMTRALEAAYTAAYPNHRFAADCFNVGFTYEGVLIAADAFRRAGTPYGPELMAALRTTDIVDHVMIGGPIRFDDKGQNNNIGSGVMQNRNRTPTVVLPAEAAATTPVLPMPRWQGLT